MGGSGVSDSGGNSAVFLLDGRNVPFGDRSWFTMICSINTRISFYVVPSVSFRRGELELFFSCRAGRKYYYLVAYYLASPLNFLLLLVPAEKIAQFFTLLIILKLALCGVTAYVYLRKLHLAENMMGVFFVGGVCAHGLQYSPVQQCDVAGRRDYFADTGSWHTQNDI